jgi:membrane protein YdbS with pleckstrin-like domain
MDQKYIQDQLKIAKVCILSISSGKTSVFFKATPPSLFLFVCALSFYAIIFLIALETVNFIYSYFELRNS